MATTDTNGKATLTACSPYDGGTFLKRCAILIKDGEDTNSDSFQRRYKEPVISMMVENSNPDHFVETAIEHDGKNLLIIDAYKNTVKK